MSEPAAEPAGLPAPNHPIRLVVTDDLHRRRLTVFFRLFLVIPHLIWLGMFTVGAVFVTFLNWWATLFSGRPAEGLHGFVAGYVRYALHVNAYVFLAANPYPKFYLGEKLPPYPVDVEIDPPGPQHRLKTLFRLPLAIPALVLTGTLTGGGANSSSNVGVSLGLTTTIAFLAWWVCMVRGRAPRGMRDLTAYAFGYATQTFAYLFLLTDRYPYTGPDMHLYTVEPPDPEGRPQVAVRDDLRRSRLLVLFRIPLAFPHIVWMLGWTIVAWIVAVLNWICALVIGRAPRPFARFLARYVRYLTHFNAFFWLVGNPFPGFTGRPGGYPVDLELDPFASQRRVVTFFRGLLALPALLVLGGVNGLAGFAAVIGWFVALARGRMPQGLRNAGAYGLGYQAQVLTYLLVLGEWYPHSSPLATWRAEAAAVPAPAPA